MKTLTRAEMKRAAQALAAMCGYSLDWDVAAEEYGANGEEVGPDNPRAVWGYDQDASVIATEEEEIMIEASMLMTEAHRPAGSCNHEGDD